jgi:hypothetical protein
VSQTGGEYPPSTHGGSLASMSASVGRGRAVDDTEDGSDSMARRINQLFLFRASTLLFGISCFSVQEPEGPVLVVDWVAGLGWSTAVVALRVTDLYHPATLAPMSDPWVGWQIEESS